FLSAAIVERDHKRQLVVVLGALLGLLQEPADLRIEVLALADDANMDAVLVQVDQVIADEPAQETHQLADLGRRARPVLRAEREDGQNANAEIAGRTHGATQSLDAASMPLAARQPARRRPAAVAVHDDGNVTRHGKIADLYTGRQRLGIGHAMALTP